MICKGNASLSNFGFCIFEVSDFLKKGAFWLGEGSDDIWTFMYMGKEIDSIITEAQRQMHKGVQYQDTQIYALLNCLIDNNIQFAMWYDTYVEDLALCNSKEEVLRVCYEQVMDESGMCEVYIVSNA